jgi:hypothetical protein
MGLSAKGKSERVAEKQGVNLRKTAEEKTNLWERKYGAAVAMAEWKIAKRNRCQTRNRMGSS